jgi:hypothetical protein
VIKAYGSQVAGLSKKHASDLIDRLKAKEGELATVAPGAAPSFHDAVDLTDDDIPFAWHDGYGREPAVHFDPWRP